MIYGDLGGNVWTVSKYSSGNSLEGLRKIVKILNQNGHFPT
jgi:hypothetical protein